MDKIYFRVHTRETWKYTLLFQRMLQRCGNVPEHLQQYVKPHYKWGWKFRGWKRTYVNVLKCMNEYFETEAIWDFKPTFEQCPLSCREVFYKTEGKQRSRNSEVKFIFTFKTDRSTDAQEVPTYTTDDFFSDIGSWLGLLVGMSFLSLIEIVTFVYTVAREQCCSKCRARIRWSNLLKHYSNWAEFG